MAQCIRTGNAGPTKPKPGTAARDGTDTTVSLSAPRNLTITQSNQTVLRANVRRRYLLLQNQSMFNWRYAWDMDALPGVGQMVLAGDAVLLRGDSVPGGALNIVGDLGVAPALEGVGIVIEG